MSDARKFRFTKERLDRLPVPTVEEAGSAGFVIYRDDAGVAGLYLLVRPSGTKTFVLRYRNRAGRERRFTIGKHGRHTVESARLAAKRLNGEIADGGDPATDRKELRMASTFDELFERYIGHIEDTSLEPEVTLRSVRRVRVLLKPSLGHRLVVETDETHVRTALAEHEGKPGNYNICLTYVRAAVNWGRQHRVIPRLYENPTEFLRTKPTTSKARVVTVAEYRAILKALDEMLANPLSDPARVLAIRWMVFSGCRCIDAMRLRKDEVIHERGVAELHKHKTIKQTGKPKRIHLSAPLLKIIDQALKLHEVRGSECDYLFHRTTNPKVSVWLAKTWEGVRLRAKTKLELRQLRTGYINAARASGLTKEQIKDVTQHMSAATLERHYLEIDQEEAAANAAQSAAMIDSTRGDVVDFKDARARLELLKGAA